MNKDARKNLAWAATQSGKSLAELSRNAGKNHAYLQQFVTRGVPAKLPEEVRHYLSAALKISEEDLGKPEHIKTEEPRRLTEAEEYAEEQEHLRMKEELSGDRAYNPENYSPRTKGALPEIDVQLGAGEGIVGDLMTLDLGGESYSGHKIIGEWLFPEEFLRSEIQTSVSKTLVMPVRGDSMEPTYRPGDRVLVDLTQRTLTEDTVYVISDGESPPQIKRLQRVMFSKPTRVEIISDNPANSRQIVELDQLKILGRVVGVVSRR